MDIIKRYKEQVDKSVQTLHKKGILTQEQAKLHRESPQTGEQNNEHLTQEQTSPYNPYKVDRSQHLKLSKVGKCSVCSQKGKYRCPQCLICYCSGLHYKSHNLFCSQQFFKKQVQNQMKSMKSSKKDKVATLQMLRQHNQLQAMSYDASLESFNEQRLVSILQLIYKHENQGTQIDMKEMNLTQQQERGLNEYIQELGIQQGPNPETTNCQHNQKQGGQLSNVLEAIQPYWLIPDGLDFYYMQQLQIQEFAQSKHPEIIAYRQLAAKKFTCEVKELNWLIKTKLSSHFRQQVMQYMVIYVLLNLTYNSDLTNKEQVSQTFDSLYIQDLCKDLTQLNYKESAAGEYTLVRLKQRISQIRSEQNKQMLSQWYRLNTIGSCKILVKNRFLLVQTFLRMLEMFEGRYKYLSNSFNQNIIQQNMPKNTSFTIQSFNNAQIDNRRQNKHTNKLLNRTTRHIKKIQLILAYLKDQMKVKSQSNNKEVPQIKRQVLQINRQVLQINRQVLQINRQVLQINRQVPQIDKQVLQIDKQVLQIKIGSLQITQNRPVPKQGLFTHLHRNLVAQQRILLKQKEQIQLISNLKSKSTQIRRNQIITRQ